MRRLTLILFVILPSAVFMFMSGCERRLDIAPFIAANQQGSGSIGDTSYVEIYPPLGNFGSPRAVLVGNDQLIYVADYDNNEIVMLDAGGTVLGRVGIPHPTTIAQNTKLDLYVGGETIAPNGIDTIGAIYRIFLVRFDTTYIARIDTIIGSLGDTTIVKESRDTSYFYNHNLSTAHRKIVWQDAGRPNRRFVGIAMFNGNKASLRDNDYLVARVGPDNTSFVDPDSRVLRFNRGDTLITPLGDLVTRPSGGTGITDIRNLTGIMIYPGVWDFVVTQNADGVAYGAIPMTFTVTKDFEGWLPTYDPSNPLQRGTDFIRPYRFQNATAVTYDRRRRETFILDSELDSVVKFNQKGQFRSESFGRSLTGTSNFPALNHPMGIAFSNDCTLYIADTGNKVIRRFKLSIQTTCF
jgi:hypothetical protein